MKKIVIIILFFSVFTNVIAQKGSVGHNEIVNFKDQTLYVILDNDSSDYNQLIRDCLGQYWKFNKYQFITGNDIANSEKYKRKWYLIRWSQFGSSMSLGDGEDHNFIGIIRPGSTWNLEKGTMNSEDK